MGGVQPTTPPKTIVKKRENTDLVNEDCFFLMGQNETMCATPSPDVDLHSCLPVCLDIFHDDVTTCRPDVIMRDTGCTCIHLHKHRCPSTYIRLMVMYVCVSLMVYINIFKLSCLWAERTSQPPGSL